MTTKNILEGFDGGQPAPSAIYAGIYYYATDTGNVYLCDGSAWNLSPLTIMGNGAVRVLSLVSLGDITTDQLAVDVPDILIGIGAPSHNSLLSVDATHPTAFKFTTPQTYDTTGSIQVVYTMWCQFGNRIADDRTFAFEICQDASGVPGATIEATRTISVMQAALQGSTVFPIAISILYTGFGLASQLSPNTSYWLKTLIGAGSVVDAVSVAYDSASGTNEIATSTDSGATWSLQSGRGQFTVGISGGPAITANADNDVAVDASSGGSYAVRGNSRTGIGVFGQTISGTDGGVQGVSLGSGPAIKGLVSGDLGGVAVYGLSPGHADAVLGHSAHAAGVHGQSEDGIGGVFENDAATGSQIRLLPKSSGTGAPGSGAHLKGEMFMDSAADIYVCTVAGSPGTWKKVTLV